MGKSIFEEMGGRYEKQGGYLIPCLTLPTEKETVIGVWGQRHLRYLKNTAGLHTRIFSQAAG